MGRGTIQRVRRGAVRRGAAQAAAVLAAAALFAPAAAEARAPATAKSAAVINTPISIIGDGDMDFGRIAPRATAGTVVLGPDQTANCTTTGGLVRSGTCRAARFTGRVGFLGQVRISKPTADRITLRGPGGATMLVTGFTFEGGGGMYDLGLSGTSHRFWILNLDGSYTIYAGATLNVGANQAPGRYLGTFSVQIDYN